MSPTLGFAVSGGPNASEIVRLARLAEDLGYTSAWVAEGHGGDQFAILGAVATATERLQLGTAITSVFVRTAPTIAMASVSDAMVDATSIAGTPEECRDKLQAYRESGLDEPIISPFARGPDAATVFEEAIRACAPR